VSNAYIDKIILRPRYSKERLQNTLGELARWVFSGVVGEKSIYECVRSWLHRNTGEGAIEEVWIIIDTFLEALRSEGGEDIEMKVGICVRNTSLRSIQFVELWHLDQVIIATVQIVSSYSAICVTCLTIRIGHHVWEKRRTRTCCDCLKSPVAGQAIQSRKWLVEVLQLTRKSNRRLSLHHRQIEMWQDQCPFQILKCIRSL
jgi:hypothetical protein